ncbi:MAG TPA: hypothetical protein VK604_14655 [Bryobacteraceae bacterium]|nr:hypothetical protein [Bryobacteraceae bacterium]
MPGTASGCPHGDKPSFRRCKCPKWIYRDRERISAKTRSWEKAEAFAKRLDEGDPFEDVIPNDDRVTIASAVDSYLDNAVAGGGGGETQNKKIRTFRGPISAKIAETKEKNAKHSPALLVWSTGRGLKHIEEITLAHMVQWRATWVGTSITRSKRQGMVCGFFYFCIRMGWIVVNSMMGVGSITIKTPPTGYFPRKSLQRSLQKSNRILIAGGRSPIASG